MVDFMDEEHGTYEVIDGALTLLPDAIRLLRRIEYTCEDVNDAHGVSFCPECGACNDIDCTNHYDEGWNCGHDDEEEITDEEAYDTLVSQQKLKLGVDDEEEEYHSRFNPECHPCGHGHADNCRLDAILKRADALKIAPREEAE